MSTVNSVMQHDATDLSVGAENDLKKDAPGRQCITQVTEFAGWEGGSRWVQGAINSTRPRLKFQRPPPGINPANAVNGRGSSDRHRPRLLSRIWLSFHLVLQTCRNNAGKRLAPGFQIWITF